MISPPSAGMLHVRRVAGVQAVVVLSGAAVGFALYGNLVAEAVLAGGGVALTNTLLLAWRMRDGPRSANQSAQGHLWTFYRSSLERFFVVGLLLAAGMGPLEFKPLPLLAGFVLGQMALVFSFLIIRRTE
jgi:ATP synthase protein I